MLSRVCRRMALTLPDPLRVIPSPCLFYSESIAMYGLYYEQEREAERALIEIDEALSCFHHA
jgi:hypothetical protein